MSEPTATLDRQYFQGSVWAFSGRAISITAALAVNALLARILDPDSFGVYVLASSIVAITSVISTLGVNTAVVRLLGESHKADSGQQSRNIIKRCFLIGACGALIAATATVGPPGKWLATRIFDSEVLANSLVWVAIWTIALTAQILVTESHRGIKAIHVAAFVGGPIGGLGLIAMLAIGIIFDVQISIRTAIAFSAIATMLAFPIGMFILWRHVGASTVAATVSPSQILMLSLPMLVTNVTLTILNQADVWIVSAFLEKSQVALYGSALQIASLISFPLIVLNAVIPAYVAENHRVGNHRQLQLALRRSTGIAAYASIIGFMTCVAVSPWILEIVYGEYYRQAATILVVIAFGRLINVLAGPCGLVLLMTGFHQAMMWVNILGSVVTVLSMVLAVQYYGLLGVATLAAVMMIIQNGVMVLLAHRKTGIWTCAQLNPKALLSA